MPKYFIRSIFGDWQEVSKDKYDSYKTTILSGVLTGKKGIQFALNKNTKRILHP